MHQSSLLLQFKPDQEASRQKRVKKRLWNYVLRAFFKQPDQHRKTKKIEKALKSLVFDTLQFEHQAIYFHFVIDKKHNALNQGQNDKA
jgi:hypothetical protein